MQATDIFHLLQGSWELDRSISGDAPSLFQGDGNFTLLLPTLLHYKEEGEMRVNGHRLFAYKEYYYSLKDGHISVFFDLKFKRLFHKIDFFKCKDKGLIGEGVHLCSKDRYATRYFFSGNEQFSTTCEVLGPKKDYVIASCYKKK